MGERGEKIDNGSKPSGRHFDIVIKENEHRPPRGSNGAILRPALPGDGLADLTARMRQTPSIFAHQVFDELCLGFIGRIVGD